MYRPKEDFHRARRCAVRARGVGGAWRAGAGQLACSLHLFALAPTGAWHALPRPLSRVVQQHCVPRLGLTWCSPRPPARAGRRPGGGQVLQAHGHPGHGVRRHAGHEGLRELQGLMPHGWHPGPAVRGGGVHPRVRARGWSGGTPRPLVTCARLGSAVAAPADGASSGWALRPLRQQQQHGLFEAFGGARSVIARSPRGAPLVRCPCCTPSIPAARSAAAHVLTCAQTHAGSRAGPSHATQSSLPARTTRWRVAPSAAARTAQTPSLAKPPSARWAIVC